MPSSSQEKEARYRANLAEARELKKANKPLEAHHESALAKYNRKLDNRKANRQTKQAEGIATAQKAISKVKPQISKPQEPEFTPTTFKGARARTLSNFPNTLNEDSTHHDAMAEAMYHLTDKLNDTPSHITKNIDNMLAKGTDSLEASQNAHEKGDVTAAKEHMQKAANHFSLATSEMGNRGVLGNTSDKIKNFVKAQAHSYVSSTITGTGAAPHEEFVPPKKKSVTKKAISTTPSSESLANSFDSLPDDHNFGSSLGTKFTGQDLISKQIEHFARGTYG
jgi:hypothetical protein